MDADAPGFDAVVLELGLPERKGLATLEKFRNFDTDTSVVALARLTDKAIGRNAVLLGAQDYLIKGSTELAFFLQLAPNLLCQLDDEAKLAPLFVFGKQVAFLG